MESIKLCRENARKYVRDSVRAQKQRDHDARVLAAIMALQPLPRDIQYLIIKELQPAAKRKLF
jgi:hypothetical protein